MTIDAAHLESLIIFPLPEVVLFPKTMVPLHIFEPRYRRMTRDALEQGRPIAMATIDADAESDRYDRPAVRPIAGVGQIVEWDELDDGRFVIVLAGEARVKIVDEYAPELPYRLVRAVPLLDEPGDTAATARAVEALRGLSMSIRAVNPRLGAVIAEELERYPDPADFTNRLTAMIGGDPERQYRMLETLRVSDRASALVERVSDILARLSISDTPGSLN